MSGRVRLTQVGFWLAGFIILLRLGYWQIIRTEDLSRQAQAQQSSASTLPAPRGEILSQDGQPLVSNRDLYSLFIDPTQLPDQDNRLEELIQVLGLPSTASAKIDQAKSDNTKWLLFASRIDSSVQQKINELNIPGVYPQFYSERFYPEGSSSAHLLGFLGKNLTDLPQGYFGLEGYYNRELTGKSGRMFEERDALNHPILLSERDFIAPQPGRNLLTSIDRTVQYVISSKLESGLAKYRASAGSVSVMNPKTGEILGMAALPSYDPDHYSRFPSELYRNPVISDTYEPGSTFKVVVMAAALDAKAVKPDSVCDTCSGPAIIADKAVRSWNDRYYPQSTMTDVILHSDNVGMVFTSRKLGKERLLKYIKSFGFGNTTGVDLEGEINQPLRPDGQWREIDLAAASFGQGIAVTPLQMLRAVSAIANGGRLVTPRVVQEIVSARGSKALPPKSAPRIISEVAAAQITQMMVNGANNGEVRYYKPKGYQIAGKTGTAQVPIEGHYDKDKVIASFIGFAPVDDPKFVMLVTLNDPQTSPWGSTTAAPLWFEIAKQLFAYFAIPPKTNI